MGGIRVVVLLGALVPLVAGAFRGDPVQSFKRMRFGDQRTMWSDVIVGQAPLFAVDRAAELHLPTEDTLAAHIPVKMQLSYDHDKFTSEWLTLSDGNGLLLDTLTVIFVYSGSDIKEVHHQQQFTKTPDGTVPPHQNAITLAYRWIHDVETDTRGGLNFLFVAGFCLTLLALLAVIFDSGDLLTTRALLVPEYEEGRKKPKVKSFVLFQADDEGEEGNEVHAGASEEEGGGGLRARGGGGGGGGGGGESVTKIDAPGGGAGKGGEKGD